MSSDRLQKRVSARPFQPIQVVMCGGQIDAVKHSEFVAASRRDENVILFHDDGDYSNLDLLLKTEIKVDVGQEVALSKRFSKNRPACSALQSHRLNGAARHRQRKECSL